MNERLTTHEYQMIRQPRYADDGAVSRGRDFLDRIFPLAEGSHHDVVSYEIYYQHLCAFLDKGKCVGLRDPDRLAGFTGNRESPASILLRDNEVRVEIDIESANTFGIHNKSGVSGIRADIRFEATRTPLRNAGNSAKVAESEQHTH